MRTPLQVVLLRDVIDRKTDAYVDALRLAFEGSSGATESPSTYLDDAVDLGIRVLEPAPFVGDEEIKLILDGARHTVVVVVGEMSARARQFQDKLGKDNIVTTSAPPASANGDIQGDRDSDVVEPGFAPVVTVLRAMQRSRDILARSIGGDAPRQLKLFISHAKIDGIAMAQSLAGILNYLRVAENTVPGFAYFYDYEHLLPGEYWKQVLDAESSQSVLIALLTESYESRYWCRREYLSAELSGMPIIVVDLRTRQYHGSAMLPFESSPTIRVHDGNLVRVVLHAMAVHLRALRAQSMASEDVRILPHRPSVYSLNHANQQSSEGNTITNKIAYPGPRMPPAFLSAVQPILTRGPGQIELVTYDDLE